MHLRINNFKNNEMKTINVYSMLTLINYYRVVDMAYKILVRCKMTGVKEECYKNLETKHRRRNTSKFWKSNVTTF
jgi:hypothetical protein